VVLADRQLDLSRQVERTIRERGGKATAVELDVRDMAAFKRVVNDTVTRSGRIDFLFNNAGMCVGGEMHECEPNDFDDVVDVDLKGVGNGMQAVYPIMIAQGEGHIVNTASVAGLVGTAGVAGYAAAKHGVVGLSKCMRLEGKRHGVRVNVLCPGAIRTAILKDGGRYGRMRVATTEAAIMKQWERVRPMAPEEFARRALDAVLADEAIIVLPRWWKAVWYLERLSPSLGLALSSYVYARIRAELETDRASEMAATRQKANGHPAERPS
jgi:NAD(P)-dependent dehydrogenase (short-subunit alcohol dehydrogenase family)